MPGRIISFGIVMSSTWTNSAGASVTGSATMQIDKSTVTPQFYVQTTGNGNGSTQQPRHRYRRRRRRPGQRPRRDPKRTRRRRRQHRQQQCRRQRHANGLAPANYAQSGRPWWPVKRLPAAPPQASHRLGQERRLQMAILANNNQGNAIQQIGGGNVLQGTVIRATAI
jgi:hypothetical protein